MKSVSTVGYTEEEMKGYFKEFTTLKVTFEKKDGSLREMVCTRDLGLVPEQHLPKSDTVKINPPGLMNVYELGVGWRSFHCGSLRSVEAV